MTRYQSLRGTQDILPPLVGKYQKIESSAFRVFRLFGYSEIRTPHIEEAGLFDRSLGDSSDIVKKEMYVFQDRKGRQIALRPEGTAPAVRALVESGVFAKEKGPWKYFYAGNMFRYERPQKGRNREFCQIGAEFFGEPGPEADFEIIQTAKNILDSLAIPFSLKLNTLGCSECRKRFSSALRDFLKEKSPGLCEDCRTRMTANPLRVLDCKNESDRELVKQGPRSADILCPECKKHWNYLMCLLRSSNINFLFSPYLVRGLDYYTRTVFEFTTEQLGAQDAILAGGRYDDLVKELGGPRIPAVGFAIGVERAAELTRETAESKTDCSLIYLDEISKLRIIPLAGRLRKKGISCGILWGEGSLKSKMRKAGESSKKVIILGESEIKEGVITLKDLEKSEEKKIKEEEIENESHWI